MTFRIPPRSLTAAAALFALAAPLSAQEATGDAATIDPTTEQAAPATEGMATDGTTTDGAATAETMPAEGDAAATEAMPAESGEAMPSDEAASGDMAPATEMTAGEAGDGAALEPGTPNADMQAVLDKLTELGAPAIGTVSVEDQRAAPTPADAVMRSMEDRGIAPDPALEAVATREVTYPDAGGGEQPIRIYTPEGDGPFPLIVYFHGGGWVIADLDTYDASARALAAGTGAVVASVEYRHAPENPSPAAHDDANAAYAWLIENSGELNADAERVALAGESAGGNLALTWRSRRATRS